MDNSDANVNAKQLPGHILSMMWYKLFEHSQRFILPRRRIKDSSSRQAHHAVDTQDGRIEVYYDANYPVGNSFLRKYSFGAFCLPCMWIVSANISCLAVTESGSCNSHLSSCFLSYAGLAWTLLNLFIFHGYRYSLLDLVNYTL